MTKKLLFLNGYTPDLIEAAAAILEKIYRADHAYQKCDAMLTDLIPADSFHMICSMTATGIVSLQNAPQPSWLRSNAVCAIWPVSHPHDRPCRFRQEPRSRMRSK